MSNEQFALGFIVMALTIISAYWLSSKLFWRRADKPLDETNLWLEERDKRIDAQFDTMRAEMRRLDDKIEDDKAEIKEIKADLKQIFKPIIPR